MKLNATAMPNLDARSREKRFSRSLTNTKKNSSSKERHRPGDMNGDKNMNKWRKILHVGRPVKNLVALSLPCIKVKPNTLDGMLVCSFPSSDLSVCMLESDVFTDLVASVCVACSLILSVESKIIAPAHSSASSSSFLSLRVVSSEWIVASSCSHLLSCSSARFSVASLSSALFRALSSLSALFSVLLLAEVLNTAGNTLGT